MVTCAWASAGVAERDLDRSYRSHHHDDNHDSWSMIHNSMKLIHTVATYGYKMQLKIHVWYESESRKEFTDVLGRQISFSGTAFRLVFLEIDKGSR